MTHFPGVEGAGIVDIGQIVAVDADIADITPAVAVQVVLNWIVKLRAENALIRESI